jgi:hypothetical protein
MPQILEDYVLHMEQGRTKNAVRVERWYLRDIFGPVCPALKQAKKRKSKRRKQADKTFVLMLVSIFTFRKTQLKWIWMNLDIKEPYTIKA